MIAFAMPRTATRTIHDRSTALLPEVTMAGWDRFQRAGELPGHVHADAFEICLIVAGSVDWWAGDDLHEVRGGDLYITRPGERHGGVDAVMNPCELYWFHVVISPAKPLPGLSERESNGIRERLMGLPIRSFRASDESKRACDRLHAEHARRDELGPMAARAALHELLAGVLRDHDAARLRRETRSDPVRIAIEFMREHLTEPLRIEAAADAAGISVGRLHARFLQETGQTPGNWRLRQLVTRAKTQLRTTDASITSVGLDLGFSSSQYFATAFKRVTGMTPHAYRASGT